MATPTPRLKEFRPSPTRAPDRGGVFVRCGSPLADVHGHALFRTESQSFLGARALGLKRTDDSHRSCSSALRRQRPQVRILSGAPIISICYANARGRRERFGYHMATETVHVRRSNPPMRPVALRPFTGPGWRPPSRRKRRQASLGDAAPLLARARIVSLEFARMAAVSGPRFEFGLVLLFAVARPGVSIGRWRPHILMQLANTQCDGALERKPPSIQRSSSDAALAPYHVERSTRRTAAVRKQRSFIDGVRGWS